LEFTFVNCEFMEKEIKFQFIISIITFYFPQNLIFRERERERVSEFPFIFEQSLSVYIHIFSFPL
jgi:hypothetical protein